MDIGVFIPINNNGWIISANSPQYMPSFELNKTVVQKAEGYGLDFALSMIKLHGFGGKTEFWDHGLESFTLMAGLASITSKIRLYASVAVLTIPPAIVARMATTVDSISGGRFGVNIVSGWHKVEYSQMGMWPGDALLRQALRLQHRIRPDHAGPVEHRDQRPEGRILPDGRLQDEPGPLRPDQAGRRGTIGPRDGIRRDLLRLQLRPGRGRERAAEMHRRAAPDAGRRREDRPRCRLLHPLHGHRR